MWACNLLPHRGAEPLGEAQQAEPYELQLIYKLIIIKLWQKLQ
nr:MAG TPA: hypothetical protein [Bacteriophage sp.]